MRVSLDTLRRHVRESNLIENITAGPGDPLYDGHLAAARRAAHGRIEHPNELHRLILGEVPEYLATAGVLRTRDVRVGPFPMPHWRQVPALMEEWLALVEQFKSATERHDTLSYMLHIWLLCIHPYVDGNGRTARLVWNMLRANKGLPWHIELAETKQFYYARIRDFEEVFFEPKHPHVYR